MIAKIERILGTRKQDEETWEGVFNRLDKERGIDQKTYNKVLICILEILEDAQEETIKYEPEVSTYEPTAGDDTDTGGEDDTRPEDDTIPTGAVGVEEEIPGGPGTEERRGTETVHSG